MLPHVERRRKEEKMKLDELQPEPNALAIGADLRMREFLEKDFPQTFSRLREAERRAVVKGYSYRNSSLSPIAADCGAKFADYLAERKWAAERAYVPDLAALEWALARARRSGFERMADAGEFDWRSAHFRFDPAMELIESQWPLVDLYANPNALLRKGEYRVLVYRDQDGATFRQLDGAEFEWLTALRAGLSLGELCEKSRLSPGQEIVSAWIASGLISAIERRGPAGRGLRGYSQKSAYLSFTGPAMGRSPHSGKMHTSGTMGQTERS